MGKVSTRTLKPGDQGKFKQNLWQAFSSLKSSQQAAEFSKNFLAPSEVAMLAKRFKALKQLTTKKPTPKSEASLK